MFEYDNLLYLFGMCKVFKVIDYDGRFSRDYMCDDSCDIIL